MFNRLLLLYSAIIVLSFSILSFIISIKVTTIIKDQSISFNKQVLQTVSTDFYSKCRNLKKSLSGLYQDKYSQTMGRDILDLLQDGSENDIDKFLEYQPSIYRYMDENVLKLDDDMAMVCILKDSNKKMYLSSRRISNPDDKIRSIIYNEERVAEAFKPKIFFKSAFSASYDRMCLLYDVIKDQNDLSKNLGYMVFGFAPEVMKNSYSHYRTFLKGDIMVLSPDGGVMFDSSEKYYEKEYPYFNLVKEAGSGSFAEDNMIINVNRNDEFGFFTVGIIPTQELYIDINSARRLIIWFMLVSILVIILLSYFSTSIFSKRIKLLISGIKKIRLGDLSTRVHIRGDDEIQEISTNLNLMCDMLNDYIKREYVYQLRQKEAELYTLQAQVNPHFLYNSLEAIRMCALKMGNTDVGRMVLLLANIFRSSVKSKMVVSMKEELESCKSFLDFYNIRYECRLDLLYDIDDDILQYGVIKHLIQPIVENVLVHGINLENDNNIVIIKGYKQENIIYIKVSDNGYGIPKDKLELLNNNLKEVPENINNHIGIYNVNHRIKLIYGAEYGITVYSVENAGTEVIIKIEARTMEELKIDVQGTAG